MAYFDRRRADIDVRYDLQKAGAARAGADVTGATLLYQRTVADMGDDFALHPEEEWSLQVEVPSPAGPPTAETVVLYVDELVEAPTTGQTIYVLVDPADPHHLVADELWDPAMPGNQPGFGKNPVRWKVPAECPNCGARVDQAAESQAEHPTCHICDAPLPCEPMT